MKYEPTPQDLAAYFRAVAHAIEVGELDVSDVAQAIGPHGTPGYKLYCPIIEHLGNSWTDDPICQKLAWVNDHGRHDEGSWSQLREAVTR